MRARRSHGWSFRAGLAELRARRDELSGRIREEEAERERLQSRIAALTERLARSSERTARHLAARRQLDACIAESEAAYGKVRPSRIPAERRGCELRERERAPLGGRKKVVWCGRWGAARVARRGGGAPSLQTAEVGMGLRVSLCAAGSGSRRPLMIPSNSNHSDSVCPILHTVTAEFSSHPKPQ